MNFIPHFPWSDLHTLNLDWLLSIVAEHERILRNLEGGANPYDSAPLPDGVADPGTVNEYARGDHRHPTDTSRASVIALEAVQNRIPLPSNGLPKMDGTADSGFYDNYSRADHVHPSDTSKLDKAGGNVTGPLSVGGGFTANGSVMGQGFADLLFGVGTVISNNADCDTLLTEGKYTCPTIGVCDTLSNSPFISAAFGMFVFRVAAAQRYIQAAIQSSTNFVIKMREYNGTTWTEWKTITPS